jgi:hypothetical protein
MSDKNISDSEMAELEKRFPDVSGESSGEKPSGWDKALTTFPYPGGEEHVPDHVPGPVGEVDVSQFVKAQSAFIRAQTEFLENRRSGADEAEYLYSLTQYSLAQSKLIKAQNDVLKSLGIV